MSYWDCSGPHMCPHRRCRDAQRIVPLLYLAQVEALNCALGSAYFLLKLSMCIPLRAQKQPEGRQRRGHDENIGIFIIFNQAWDLRYQIWDSGGLRHPTCHVNGPQPNCRRTPLHLPLPRRDHSHRPMRGGTFMCPSEHMITVRSGGNRNVVL